MNARLFSALFCSAFCAGTAAFCPLDGAFSPASNAVFARLDRERSDGESERGSFVSRLGASLKERANKISPNSDSDAERSNAPLRPGARVGANPSGRAGVPTPRPLPSQRLAAQAPARTAPRRQSCVLQSSRRVGSADVVEISLEASGDVSQTMQNGQVDRSPMEVVAGFKYEERFEKYSANGAVKTIREYEQAGMRRKFGGVVARPLLDASRKHVVVEFDGKKRTIFSPGGPFKSEQYSLLSELPCDTTILDRLLPNRAVKLGEDWRVSNDVVQALLGVDALENNTVHLTLTSIVDDFAEVDIYLQGDVDSKGVQAPSTLHCASDGATVAIDLEGKFQFDLKSNRLTWIGLRVDERRSESIVAPGLEWSATLQIKIAPLDEPTKLTDDVVADLRVPATPEALELYYNAQKGFWKFRHSRRWKMIEDGETAAALCYVVGGETVAQCNVLSNGKIDLATQPTIDGYKAEIRKGLADRFGTFVQEAVYDAPNGDSIYFVVADGQYEDVPFRWIYYLITDEDGNQATIMFEIRADLLDQYDDSGSRIVETFELVPRVDPAAKAAAERAAAEAAKNQKSNGGVPSASEKLETAPSPTPKKAEK